MTTTPPDTTPANRTDRFAGKVALVTGAARGQGRSHALALAAEGADVIITDIAGPVDTVRYDLATSQELDTVANDISALGRKVHAGVVDVRDADAMVDTVSRAVDSLGRLDIVVANAGILGPPRSTWEMSVAEWDAVIGVNLTGVWSTFRAAIPHIIESGDGGSLIAISSIAGLRGVPYVGNYVAAKHGVVGLIGTLANELAQYGIRANSIHPTNVRTPMIDNPSSALIFRPDLEEPTLDDGYDVLKRINLLDMPWIDSSDVTDAVTWLASSESKRITGTALPVDAGMLSKYPG
ncbi:SDR family mycofactocin-dependent oxidoreductase [Rhodococcus sp. 15-649-1-2]|nr:mycofactocin-coupled SDR family oxidoreductase [Rhodococcus sp. 15-649-1-2]OZE79138.1 SDR family mycofactocin-dependent oxidoreductase [Rhodococcus sp. 15-649-1-2]